MNQAMIEMVKPWLDECKGDSDAESRPPSPMLVAEGIINLHQWIRRLDITPALKIQNELRSFSEYF